MLTHLYQNSTQMAKKTKDKRTLAKYLYVEMNMIQAEVAEFIGSSPTQVSRWVRAEKWETLRKAHNLSSTQLIANAYEMSQAIYDTAKAEKRNLTASESDQLVKLSTVVKNLEKEMNVQTATLVLKKFNEYLIQSNRLDLAKMFVDPQRDFVLNLMPNE